MSAEFGRDESVKIKLTDEQMRQLKETFGDDVAERLQHIDISRIAGFMRSEMAMN